MTDPLEEIRAIRKRLADLEALATKTNGGTPPMTLETSIADSIASHTAPDAARRRLEAEARRFVADPQAEAALAARARDPQKFDPEYGRMGGDLLALSLYAQGREAAVELGRFAPETKETA